MIYARQGGRWLHARIRDEPPDEVSPHEQLLELEWMLGEWVNESDDGMVQTHCKWSDDGNFLLREFDVKVEGRIALSGTQRIGWDAQRKQFRMWVFDDRGGFAEGLMSRDGDRWVTRRRASARTDNRSRSRPQSCPSARTGSSGRRWSERSAARPCLAPISSTWSAVRRSPASEPARSAVIRSSETSAAIPQEKSDDTPSGQRTPVHHLGTRLRAFRRPSPAWGRGGGGGGRGGGGMPRAAAVAAGCRGRRGGISRGGGGASLIARRSAAPGRLSGPRCRRGGRAPCDPSQRAWRVVSVDRESALEPAALSTLPAGPGLGNRPQIGGQPGIGNRPGMGNQPGIGNRPGVGNRPGIGNRPGVGGRPGIGNRPGVGNQPGVGNRPGIDGRPGIGDRPGASRVPTCPPTST